MPPRLRGRSGREGADRFCHRRLSFVVALHRMTGPALVLRWQQSREGASAMDKRIPLVEAASLLWDGATIAVGGNLLHRGPFAFVRELARREVRDLEIVKTAGAYDVDLLAAAGCLRAASCGFVGFENEFGLAPGYRRAVESGIVQAHEHACYTVIQ